MKTTVEREVKLEAGPGFVLPELGGEARPSRVFMSTYHDTDDLALARNGVTLRYRAEEGAGVWQLKLPRGAARAELEQDGRPARPPLELSSLLVAYLRGRGVAPVARLRTRRETVRVDGAEVVDDAVALFEGRRIVGRFRELEVELVEGDERTLRRIAKELRRAGAMPTGVVRPKLHRALDLDLPPASPVLSRRTPPGVALGVSLAEQVRRLLLHDPGVRLGDDPEDLHQFRVATRRLRAFLRAGRPLLDPGWSEPLRDEIGWLGRALGPARDLDVLIDRLTADAATVEGGPDTVRGLLDALGQERETARGAVAHALSSDRYLALLDRLDGVAAPELSGSELALRDVWRQEWARTRKAFALLDRRSPDTALHAARIRAKRARYAAELAAHELGKPASAFIGAAKDVQDVLGEHQDAAVAEERIVAWAAAAGGDDGGADLLERERQRKRDARTAWPAAWKALRRAAKQLA